MGASGYGPLAHRHGLWPPEEQPYLWTHFWAHAVDGGAAGIYRLRELSQSNPAFLSKLANSLGAYGSVQRQAGELPAARESFREGLAVLLPLLQINRDSFFPLAQNLAGVYFETLRQLGQEPDPELMAAHAAAFADDQDAGAT
jgi:hypothetical protein